MLFCTLSGRMSVYDVEALLMDYTILIHYIRPC